MSHERPAEALPGGDGITVPAVVALSGAAGPYKRGAGRDTPKRWRGRQCERTLRQSCDGGVPCRHNADIAYRHDGILYRWHTTWAVTDAYSTVKAPPCGIIAHRMNMMIFRSPLLGHACERRGQGPQHTLTGHTTAQSRLSSQCRSTLIGCAAEAHTRALQRRTASLTASGPAARLLLHSTEAAAPNESRRAATRVRTGPRGKPRHAAVGCRQLQQPCRAATANPTFEATTFCGVLPKFGF